MKMTVALLALVVAAGSAQAAPAPGGPGGKGGRGGMHGMGRMQGGPGGGMPFSHAAMIIAHREALSLTEDQVNRLQTIHLNSTKEMIRRGADIRIGYIDLMQLLNQPTPDRGRVDNAVREIGKQMTDLGLSMVHNHLDSMNVLTPEQRQRVQGMMPCGTGGCPMGGMMGGMHGGMGGGMMGGHGGGMGTPAGPAPAPGAPH